jgi:hypothetical protein
MVIQTQIFLCGKPVKNHNHFLYIFLEKTLDKKWHINYNDNMKIRYTVVYRIWYKNLTDVRARVRIDLRLNAVQKGTFGDQKSVGDGCLSSE